MQITIRNNAAENGERSRVYNGALIRIGRNPDAEICFHENTNGVVSWDHATIEVRSGGAFLQDAGSSNGTYLNDRRIERRTRLKSRDTIALGQTGPRLCIEVIDAGPPARAATNGVAASTDPSDSASPPSPRHRRQDDTRSSFKDSRLWKVTRDHSVSAMVIVGLLILLACALTAMALNNRQTQPSAHVDVSSVPAAIPPVVTTPAEPATEKPPVAPPAPTQELAEIRELLDTLFEEVRTKREPMASRDRLIKYALQQRVSEKEMAGAERDETARAIDRIRIINESRDYVLGSFDPQTRGHVPEFTELSHRLKRLERVQQQWTDKFITLPEDSRGQIWSGRALNQFLQLCGGVALRHQFLGDQLGEEAKELQHLLDTRDLAEEDRSRLVGRLDEVMARLKLLEELTGLPVLNETDRRNLKLQRGSSQEALSVDAEGKPRSIQWGVFATLPDGDFRAVGERLSTLHESFIGALKSSGLPDLAIGDELLQAIDELDQQFQEYRVRYSRGDLAGKRSGLYTAQLYRAKGMIEQLRIDAVAMMTASSSDQIFLDDHFDGSTVESLLAHATNNSLTFSAANQLERPTYEKVYREMVRYYLTLHALAQAIDRDEGRIAPLADREQDLMAIEYENSLKDLQGMLHDTAGDGSASLADVIKDQVTRKVVDEVIDWIKIKFGIP